MRQKVIYKSAFKTCSLNRYIPNNIEEEYEKYVLKERYIRYPISTIPIDVENVCNIAISEDLEFNSLICFGIEILNISPVVWSKCKKHPYISIYYEAHFKE